MAKESNAAAQSPRDTVVSIIGPAMRVIGDCETDGTLRVEGTVDGTVRAGKAVVVGKDGIITGDLLTQDAIVGGKVTGTIIAESRLELQATCNIEGEVRARRIKLDEGGRVNGKVTTGEVKPRAAKTDEMKMGEAKAGEVKAGELKTTSAAQTEGSPADKKQRADAVPAGPSLPGARPVARAQH